MTIALLEATHFRRARWWQSFLTLGDYRGDQQHACRSLSRSAHLPTLCSLAPALLHPRHWSVSRDPGGSAPLPEYAMARHHWTTQSALSESRMRAIAFFGRFFHISRQTLLPGLSRVCSLQEEKRRRGFAISCSANIVQSSSLFQHCIAGCPGLGYSPL